jgi:hypothetical protein
MSEHWHDLLLNIALNFYQSLFCHAFTLSILLLHMSKLWWRLTKYDEGNLLLHLIQFSKTNVTILWPIFDFH